MEVTGQEARFRAMFAEEAEGRLATLSELLLELERNGEDQELLSSVFREAHTLKGAAAVVGLADVLRVAHAMEEVLEGLRRGDPTTPAAVDALLGAVDGMREMVPAVLVVDDTTVVRELERSILEEAGYRVRTAADGRLALAALADTPADLVVTDVEMPNCDGLELTRAIRAQPALTGLPVVVVTSRSSDADRRLAMDAGADAYLVKGDLDRRTLLEVVGRLLGRAVQPAGGAGR